MRGATAVKWLVFRNSVHRTDSVSSQLQFDLEISLNQHLKQADNTLIMLARCRGKISNHLVFAAFAIGSACAVAQAGSDQDLMSMNLEDLAHVKVYSASRHFEGVRKAPSSVSIITSAQIRLYGCRTLGEVISSLRGFYTSNDRLYTYLGVRGFMRHR